MQTNLRPEEFKDIRITVVWIGRTVGGRIRADIRLEGIDYVDLGWGSPHGDFLERLPITKGQAITVDLAKGAGQQREEPGG